MSDHDQSLNINVTTRQMEMAENYLKLKTQSDRRIAIALTKALREIHANHMETSQTLNLAVNGLLTMAPA